MKGSAVQGREDKYNIGEIKAFMRTTAPYGYLICDGSSYNTADYPLLVALFTEQFGSAYYFGGSGSTFKVPDLRGEFLRGTGTNSHSGNGNGDDVGTHQDATQILNMGIDASGSIIHRAINTSWNMVPKADSNAGTAQTKQVRTTVGSQESTSAGYYPYITSRPTNTSVLYCIRAY